MAKHQKWGHGHLIDPFLDNEISRPKKIRYRFRQEIKPHVAHLCCAYTTVCNEYIAVQKNLTYFCMVYIYIYDRANNEHICMNIYMLLIWRLRESKKMLM